jgi:hypothetical protein
MSDQIILDVTQDDGGAKPDPNCILTGYAEKEDFARANKVTSRTLDRYRKRPNGLPWLAWGGKIYIHIETGKQWLAEQLKKPNPTSQLGVKRTRARSRD